MGDLSGDDLDVDVDLRGDRDDLLGDRDNLRGDPDDLLGDPDDLRGDPDDLLAIDLIDKSRGRSTAEEEEAEGDESLETESGDAGGEEDEGGDEREEGPEDDECGGGR